MASRYLQVTLVSALAAVLGVTGCGTPADPDAGDARTECPVDALEEAEESTDITFWHVQQAKNEEILTDLVEQFESSHEGIRVELVNVATYPDAFEKYKAALTAGDLPDLVQMDEGALQALVDSESTIPIERCIEADDYPLDDFLPQGIDRYTTENVLRAMPWTVSNPVLIYDKNVFAAAGLDPDRPPQTLEEVTAYSQQIVDAGAARHGISVRAEAFVNEALYAKSAQLYMDHGNGREARATKTLLETEAGLEIWTWWHDIVDTGLGVFTGSQPDNFDNLWALGTGDAAMTIDASSVIGSVFAVLESGEFGDLELGVGPLPGLEAEGGVPVSDASLWIPKTGSPKDTAAAWKLVAFLSAPDQQAAYAVGTSGGFLPIRHSAVEDPAVRAMWDANPEFKVPYEQFEAGHGSTAASGAVSGAHVEVRAVVRDALTGMLAGDLSPEEALAQAQRQATNAIRDYNERIDG